MKNILILNAGTRNKLIQDFKNDLKGKARIIVTDNFYLAPALYEADKYYVTKRWDEPGYWDEICEICNVNNIGMITSLIDPELEALAQRRELFEKKGILVNISDYQVVHDCFDKGKLLDFLKNKNYPWIQTYNTYQEVEQILLEGDLHFPLFVKPRCGSGSAEIEKVFTREQLKLRVEHDSNILIQEYMEGQEFGVDVYVDFISREVISIFAKKKLKMRAGETDKSVSYRDERIFKLIKRFVKDFGLLGVNDIDVFEKNGEYYISEVNPRFGGGYLHAYECGQRFPEYLVNNMNGIVNVSDIGNYEEDTYMMKYFDIKMLKAGE